MAERRLIRCKMCGAYFRTDAPNSKYCSLTCAHAAKRMKASQWAEAHPHYQRDRKRERVRLKAMESKASE